jgi:hypothetical protein
LGYITLRLALLGRAEVLKEKSAMQKKTQEIGDNVEEVFPYLLGI